MCLFKLGANSSSGVVSAYSQRLSRPQRIIVRAKEVVLWQVESPAGSKVMAIVPSTFQERESLIFVSLVIGPWDSSNSNALFRIHRNHDMNAPFLLAGMEETYKVISLNKWDDRQPNWKKSPVHTQRPECRFIFLLWYHVQITHYSFFKIGKVIL